MIMGQDRTCHASRFVFSLFFFFNFSLLLNLLSSINLSLFSPGPKHHSFLLFCRHLLSTIFIFFKSCKSLISLCITPSLESACLISSVYWLIVSFAFTAFHSWQFMYIIIISTLLNFFSFSLSAQNLSFSQVFPAIDFWHLIPAWTAFSGLDCFSDLFYSAVCFIFISLFLFSFWSRVIH